MGTSINKPYLPGIAARWKVTAEVFVATRSDHSRLLLLSCVQLCPFVQLLPPFFLALAAVCCSSVAIITAQALGLKGNVHVYIDIPKSLEVCIPLVISYIWAHFEFTNQL